MPALLLSKEARQSQLKVTQIARSQGKNLTSQVKKCMETSKIQNKSFHTFKEFQQLKKEFKPLQTASHFTKSVKPPTK